MWNLPKRIVIFDDDEDILSICTYYLEGEGWDVTTYCNCNDPVAKIAESHPDVILMDNWIPDGGGIIATQKIKNAGEFRHIPIIYFSANTDIRTLAESAGADDYIPKPFDITDLRKTLEKALRK